MCDEQFKRLPVEVKRWIICIISELEFAEKKHPKWPTCPIKPKPKRSKYLREYIKLQDWIYAAGIIGEESGELLRAAIQFKHEKGPFWSMHREAIQTAAMCLRFLKNSPELPKQDL